MAMAFETSYLMFGLSGTMRKRERERERERERALYSSMADAIISVLGAYIPQRVLCRLGT